VQVVEYYTEGAASPEELAEVRRQAEDYKWIGGFNNTPGERRDAAALAAVALAAGTPVEAERIARYAAEAVKERCRVAERAAQAALARDIFDPSRPVSPAAARLSRPGGSVVKLALTAYNDQEMPSGHLDAGRLAVLADALEEGGCEDAAILSHCRGRGPHVWGCWVVDAILGKT
jgi:hypothetical protein